MIMDNSPKHREIAAGAFKARCLKLMDEVRRGRVAVVITKRGEPVAKLTPVDEQPPPLFGCLSGSVTVVGDIVAPIGVTWESSVPGTPRAGS